MFYHQDYNNGCLSSSLDSSWTRHEDKLFERALLLFPEDIPDRWQKIAGCVPDKTPDDVRLRYEALLHDLFEIDSGRVQLPKYFDDDGGDDDDEVRWESCWGISLNPTSAMAIERRMKCPTSAIERRMNGPTSAIERRMKGKEKERKRGSPWTENEHRLFLLGLQLYGKGDWRSISRNVVVTRTPTQVASHAQKYFLRQNANLRKKERKRASIHDITTPSDIITIPPSHNYPAEGPIGYQNYGFSM